MALSVPSGVLAGLQAVSGFNALLGQGIESWQEMLGFKGDTGEATSNYFSNISMMLERGKQQMTGSSDPDVLRINAIGDGVGQIAVAISIGVLTGGAGALPAFLGAAGVQAAGSAYNGAYTDALAAGMDADSARNVAAIDASLYGIASTVTNIVPGLAYFGGATKAAVNTMSRAAVAASLKKMSTSPELIKKIAAGAFAEGMQEVVEDATANLMQVLVYDLNDVDPMAREVMLKQLANGDEEAWRSAIANFLGGVGGGSVGAAVTAKLNIKQYKLNDAQRTAAWKAFEDGINANPALKNTRKTSLSLGNPVDLDQDQLKRIAQNPVGETGSDGNTVLPEDAIRELIRRGIKLPDGV